MPEQHDVVRLDINEFTSIIYEMKNGLNEIRGTPRNADLQAHYEGIIRKLEEYVVTLK